MSHTRRTTSHSSVELLVTRLTNRWRGEADVLHRRGADEQALAVESCLADLQDEARTLSLEELTLEQAAELSGFSYSAVQKMVSEGAIENVGKKGAPRVRRGDLPMKACDPAKHPASEPDLAELVLAQGG